MEGVVSANEYKMKFMDLPLNTQTQTCFPECIQCETERSD